MKSVEPGWATGVLRVVFQEREPAFETRIAGSTGSHAMQKPFLLFLLLFLVLTGSSPMNAQAQLQEDVFPTSEGSLAITFVGHGTLMFRFGEQVIHVDPVGQEADYASMPDADLILVTHEHGDHLDPEAIKELRKAGTEIVVSRSCEGRIDGARVMNNGEVGMIAGFQVEAVPAYNLLHRRSEGQPYHPKGDGNGYLITFGDLRVYVAGDTENTPEMKALKDIDVAFLPMNLPYTMTPSMVADAAIAFRPKVLYPYHFEETDTDELVRLLVTVENIEVRVRALK
jgi:L-ascorbate metabolism protein UlaG (beta-lactamase superfamily)